MLAKRLPTILPPLTLNVIVGKLRALDRPKPNAVKFFSAVELIALLADRE